ncbi:hypothetical protein FTO70_06250 [Methanosarcina sp. KYL-1]|nr:hypothetical protein [Methanosarcina sp. KYL-1]
MDREDKRAPVIRKTPHAKGLADELKAAPRESDEGREGKKWAGGGTAEDRDAEGRGLLISHL